jgi:hypothetical protein
MKYLNECILAVCLCSHGVQSFSIAPVTSQNRQEVTTDAWVATQSRRHTSLVWSSAGDGSATEENENLNEEVGNLVANDEWEGLTMELSEMIKLAITEDLKENAREFLGKDDYKIGDICKEVDIRVKDGVADLRGKEEYELGKYRWILESLQMDLYALTAESTRRLCFGYG